MATLKKGQRVQYRLLWAYPDHRDWVGGYRVVEPVSPHAKRCALLQRPDGLNFNAPYEDIRPDIPLVDIASEFEIEGDLLNEPYGGKAEEFEWVEKMFDLRKLQGFPEEWRNWYAEEKEIYPSPIYLNDLEKAFCDNPQLCGVHVVVKGRDGKFHLWDGNHRTGIAATRGITKVPAIIGYRKRGVS